MRSAKLLKQLLDNAVALVQRGIESGGIFASGFGHVGTSAAGAANFFRDLGDDFAGLNFRREIFGDADDECDFAIADGAEDDYAGAEFVAQVVDEDAKLRAIDIVGAGGEDFHAFDLANVFSGRLNRA